MAKWQRNYALAGFSAIQFKECTCSPSAVSRYRRRISGPLLDRIDLFVEVPRVEYEKLMRQEKGENSKQVRQRIRKARKYQEVRFGGTDMIANSDMGPAEVWKCCQVDESAKALLQAAMNQMNLSARGFHRILKLSRTIADLAGEESIGVAHLAEALQYRPSSQS